MWRWAGAWRVELVGAVGLSLGRTLFAHVIGWGLADLAMVGAVVVGLRSPLPRDWVARQILGGRRRRRWSGALAAVAPPPGTPVLIALGADASGEWARVRVAGGATVAELANRSEALAAWFAVGEVRVRRHPTNAGVALIRALRHDPLAGPPLPWPLVHAEATSLWRPVPVGLDEDGRLVAVTLFEHNILVGGEPGAGKSVAVSQLVAAAALDPTAVLWLLDGKLVELAPWRPVAERFAGVDIAEGTAVLREVQAVMDARYAELLDGGRRKVAPATPLQLVVVDELAHYVGWPERKARDAFTDVLRDLVSRGRAAGIVVVAATQKPSSDVVPTSLRDLFGYRWALRCTTPAASDTILGTGWATNGITASTISPAARGVGFLLHESGEPVRLRAYHLDDSAVSDLAGRARQLRAGVSGDG